MEYQFARCGDHWSCLFVCLDDLIIVSTDKDSHLQKPDYANYVKLTKYAFLKSHIQFLNYIVDKGGTHTADSKVTPDDNFLSPKTTEYVRSFLDLEGYYRAFVKYFASTASPVLKKGVLFLWKDARQ